MKDQSYERQTTKNLACSMWAHVLSIKLRQVIDGLSATVRAFITVPATVFRQSVKTFHRVWLVFCTRVFIYHGAGGEKVSLKTPYAQCLVGSNYATQAARLKCRAPDDLSYDEEGRDMLFEPT
jgi:hypothetical protein